LPHKPSKNFATNARPEKGAEFCRLEMSEDQTLAKSGADNSERFEGHAKSFRSAMA
jgi:hypothetical protein